jgi:hypothetical protein
LVTIIIHRGQLETDGHGGVISQASEPRPISCPQSFLDQSACGKVEKLPGKLEAVRRLASMYVREKRKVIG